MSADRLFALVWLCLCAGMAIHLWQLAVPYAYEPLGPRAFPLLVIGLMAVCCFILLVRPDPIVLDFRRAPLAHGVLLLGLLLSYAALFEAVGYPLATFFAMSGMARLFGGRWVTSLLTAGLVAGLGFVLFDQLLGVTLPLGLLGAFG